MGWFIRNGCEVEWEFLSVDAGWVAKWRVAVVVWGYLVAVLLAGRTELENELRAASMPCCACPGDGAGVSAVVGLDPDAGLIVALLPLCPAHPSPLSHAASSL